MRFYYYPFIISFLAGLSTLFGYFLIYLPKRYQNKIISYSLAFSSGVLFTISFCSLILEAFQFLIQYHFFYAILIFSLFFTIGIMIPIMINSFITYDSSLYRIGILSVISLMIHNIPEGILSFLTTTSNLQLGLSLSLAIAIHNIPEGISIAVPIYYSTYSKKRAFFFTFISGFSEFFGSIMAYFFFRSLLSPMLFGCILSITAGIMIYLTFFELIPKALEVSSFSSFVLSFMIGFLIMISCIIFI